MRMSYDFAMTPAAVAPFCPDSTQLGHQCREVAMAAVLRAGSDADPDARRSRRVIPELT